MAKKTKWMNLDEAVSVLMKARRCSKEEAMDILAFEVQSKKMEARKVPLPNNMRPHLLPTQEAVQMFEQGSEQAYMTLGFFLGAYGFTFADIQHELEAGRLRVSAQNDSIVLSIKMGESVPADFFMVTVGAIKEWMRNPNTPPRLLSQMTQAMRRPDFGENVDTSKYAIINNPKAN